MSDTNDVLRDLLFATLKEQRAKRRWSIFFKLLFFLFLFLLLWLLWPQDGGLPGTAKTPHTALVDIKGEINSDGQANADDIITGLDAAFKDPGTKGVILRIDSPGGSPVQAVYVYNEIWRLRRLHPNIKVYAVCTDICTSAAYYMASAANEIYASPASLVGSIGVLIDGFGFVDTLQKLGVERRLMISGIHKGFLDPFSPLSSEDKQFAQTMLDEVHAQFITSVLQGRGKRLKVNNDTFSGLAWTGQQALAQGLIDGYGSAADIARNVIKAENIEDYTVTQNVFNQLAQRFGESFATRFASALGFGNEGLRAQTSP